MSDAGSFDKSNIDYLEGWCEGADAQRPDLVEAMCRIYQKKIDWLRKSALSPNRQDLIEMFYVINGNRVAPCTSQLRQVISDRLALEDTPECPQT